MRCMDQTKSHPAMIPSAKTSTVNVGESGSSISAAPANCCLLFYLHNQESLAADKIRPIGRIGSNLSRGESLARWRTILFLVSATNGQKNVSQSGRPTTICRPMRFACAKNAPLTSKSKPLRPSPVVERKKLVRFSGVARCRSNTPPAAPSETQIPAFSVCKHWFWN